MLADEQQSIRKRALAVISHSIEPTEKRNFVLPKLNHSAELYFDLSHSEGAIAIPPMLQKTEILNEVEQTPLWFDDIPCHSQAVEQTVAAAKSKIGYQSRHRTIFFFFVCVRCCIGK